MKNKSNILLTLLASMLLLWSCEKEALLTPSFVDEDRVATQIDLSKPLVKFLYETYDVGLLFEYHDTLDFMYVAESKNIVEKWERVSLPKVDSQYIDASLAFLDTTLFRYFKEEISFNNLLYKGADIYSLLPHKILLSQNLYSDVAGISPYLTESDGRATEDGKGALHALGNEHAFALNVDIPTITSSQLQYDNFRKDMMFVLLSHVFEQNQLSQYLPDNFYVPANQYYGLSIGETYEAEGFTINPELLLVDKDWFFSKGYIDAKYFYNTPIGLSYFYYWDEGTLYTVDKAIRSTARYTFVAGDEKFFRSYLNECIYATEEALEAYPPFIKEKLRMTIDFLMSLGVDIVAYNPSLTVLYAE